MKLHDVITEAKQPHTLTTQVQGYIVALEEPEGRLGIYTGDNPYDEHEQIAYLEIESIRFFLYKAKELMYTVNYNLGNKDFNDMFGESYELKDNDFLEAIRSTTPTCDDGNENQIEDKALIVKLKAIAFEFCQKVDVLEYLTQTLEPDYLRKERENREDNHDNSDDRF
jgi:hypothetical protein